MLLYFDYCESLVKDHQHMGGIQNGVLKNFISVYEQLKFTHHQGRMECFYY